MANDKQTDSANPAAAFIPASQRLLTDLGEVVRPTRAGGAAPAGFDAAAYAAADLLEVHFADGSVYYTNPEAFAREHGGGATRAATAADRVPLPFSLTLGAAASATRAGPAGVPVERYRIARLTPPTTLDKAYALGDAFTSAWNSLFGSSVPGTGRAAAALCHAYETSQLHPSVGKEAGGLLQWTGGGWVPADAGRLPADLRDVVLLLHGTASSTEGSFGGLWKAPAGGVAPDWTTMAGKHGRLVLGYEHRSLSLGPLDNAFALVKALAALGLPAGTTVHMVSHSRGGLLADLVALALGSAADVRERAQRLEPLFLDLFPDDHAQRKTAQALFALLGAATFQPGWQAGTCVRVASPSRGTLLADRRTDFFLSMLLRGVGLVFGGNGNPWYERLQGLVRGLVAARADAEFIPGLEAMIPGRPLSLALNTALQPAVTLPGRLRVIAGDSQGYGPLGLASLLGDVFYGLHDHDFVVHTHAMFGGLPRADARSRRVEDRSVTHFGYFEPGSLTRGPILRVLDGDDTGFLPLADDEARTRGLWQALDPNPLTRRTQAQWLADITAPGAARKPIIVVLPGIMGSELARAQDSPADPVWLALASMVNGRLADLDLKSTRTLRASGMMALAYERLLERLRPRFHVVTFPFDWRQAIPDSARQLIALLKVLLPEAQRLEQPVHLLAHSMGGLVARMALWCDGFGLAAERGDTTQRLEARGLRLVQCGTPNRGSYAPLQLLMQQHPLTGSIATIARGVTPRDLAKFGAAYPGLMGMMPAEADPLAGDLFTTAAWAKVVQADQPQANTPKAVVTPDPEVLKAAAQVRDWLDASFPALKANPNVFYVAGQGLTPLHLKVLGGSPGRPGKLVLGVSSQGDGTVPWNSTLEPVRTWYTDCEHGSLLDHPDAFGGIVDLLTQGRTTQLRQQKPALRSNDAALENMAFTLPALPSLPADPVAHVLGLTRAAERRGEVAPVSVRIVHGSLDYARHALLVGHNSDDGVHGAVARVDTKYRGELRRAARHGLFTGALGAALYLSDPALAGRPAVQPGAVVVGLGPVGVLTPAALTDTIARGVLRLVDARLHEAGPGAGDAPLVVHLSSVLIGSNVQALPLSVSLAALLQGVWRAAQDLASDAALPRAVRIGEVEIVELHETQAHDAAYALARLLRRPDWAARFRWPAQVLEAREGGICGYRLPRDTALWHRLSVRSDEFGALRFELAAERARVESTQNRAGLIGLEDFIARACDAGATRGSTPVEQDEFGRGLFNQLLPHALKGRLVNYEQTVLLLDHRSAALPWELLAPPRTRALGDEGAQPLAVQAGMLRQRATDDFRTDTETARPRLGGDRLRALVLGEPDTSGWHDAQGQPLAFSPLPGARVEADSVADQLNGAGWLVERMVRTGDAPGASFTDVRWQLMRPQPWDVLHLAGHGMVDLWLRNVPVAGTSVAQRGTGMVLSGQQLLSADVVRQMDPPPAFVFLNCCYSGRDGEAPSPQGLQGRPSIAASLALAFIEMGSQAVVAAGWQVDDVDGQTFADALYAALLAGETFGNAVLAARRAVWRGGTTRSNTWGAYQCYGNPDWTFPRAPGAPAAGPMEGSGAGTAAELGPLAGAECSMSPRELADRIMQLVHGAGDSRAAGAIAALDALQQRLAADPARAPWLAHSLVQSSLMLAWRELNQTDRALRAAFDAVRGAHADLTLGHAEKAANLLSKLPALPGGAKLPAAAARDASLQALQALDGLSLALSWQAPALLQAAGAAGDHAARRDGASAERDCLRGSALARLANHDSGVSAAALRMQAAAWYARAFDTRRALGLNPGERGYALSNAAMLSALVALDQDPLRPAVLAGAWWGAPADADAPQAPFARPAQPLATALAGWIDGLQAELSADVASDFWADASLLDLHIARLLWALLTPDTDAAQVQLKIALLPDTLERVLLRWPSPGQVGSLAQRPSQALQALVALAERQAAAAATPPAPAPSAKARAASSRRKTAAAAAAVATPATTPLPTAEWLEPFIRALRQVLQRIEQTRRALSD